jgi:predicted O-linked N-acetylglucosamine transferase (SPINDLY family)
MNILEKAITLHQKNEFEQAQNLYEKIIEQEPNNFEATHLLACLNMQLKNFEYAFKLIDRSININPLHHAPHNNLGVIFRELKEYEKAIKAFTKAIELNPNYAEAYNNLAISLKDIKLYEDAITNFNKAIELKKNYAEAYNNLGVLFSETNNYKNALKNFEIAINIKQNYIEAFLNIANLYLNIEKYNEAYKFFEIALKLNPKLDDGSVFEIKTQTNNWIDFDKNISDLRSKILNNKIIVKPFLTKILFDDPNFHKESSINYADSKGLNNKLLNKIKYNIKEKIVIGYFSSDFKDHAVGQLIVELLELHDKKKFEIIGFYNDNIEDDLTIRIKKSFNKFYNIKNLINSKVISLTKDLGVDIAIDLNGYTKNSRVDIFSERFCPLQISFLGYPGTSGIKNIDYLIADKNLIPEKNKKYYTEKIIYLPNCYQPSDSKRLVIDKKLTRKEFNIKNDQFVFCCFNTAHKINPKIFDSWASILRATNNSVIWLLKYNNISQKNLEQEAMLRKIDPERIIFCKKTSNQEHIKRFQLADLFLDTFPYGAHTTANEALFSGLPIVTIIGESFQSRVCSSLLSTVGLKELITNSYEEYENLAINIAKNPQKLQSIKDSLKMNIKNSPLFNSKFYTENLEKAYINIYERHNKNLEPEHIYIN